MLGFDWSHICFAQKIGASFYTSRSHTPFSCEECATHKCAQNKGEQPDFNVINDANT